MLARLPEVLRVVAPPHRVLACLLLYRTWKEVFIMYSILYIIGAIVVVIIVLRLLGVY